MVDEGGGWEVLKKRMVKAVSTFHDARKEQPACLPKKSQELFFLLRLGERVEERASRKNKDRRSEWASSYRGG